jgi:shikimate kinase
MSILLLGYRGSGKTTIGKRLADRLWQKFVDTDDLITKAAGMTIKDVFEKHGEEHFRDLETEALRKGLALEDHVISLGGGVIKREENRQLIAASPHKRIYLRCEPEVLHHRIHGDPTTAATRPALSALGGNLDEIKTILDERHPLYKAVSTAELDVTNLTPQDAVVYIVRLLSK